MTNTTQKPDIWHSLEKQDNKLLHIIKTRDTATANAAMAGTQLLEALESLIELDDVKALETSRYNYVRKHFANARAAIARAKGE